MMGYGFGMGAFGWLGMLLFWALIIGGIIYLVKHFSAQTSNQGTGKQTPVADSAMEILRVRFAKGEIDMEEFEERKRTLA